MCQGTVKRIEAETTESTPKHRRLSLLVQQERFQIDVMMVF